MIPSARPAPTESRRLSETRKAAVFSVMLLTLALAAVLLIRALDPPQMLAFAYVRSADSLSAPRQFNS